MNIYLKESGLIMSRVCELTGKKVMVGNNVSHANNKTKRKFYPNLNAVTLTSDGLDRSFKFKVSAAALRSVDHKGGLDKFLSKAKDENLSPKALKIKKDLEKLKKKVEETPLEIESS